MTTITLKTDRYQIIPVAEKFAEITERMKKDRYGCNVRNEFTLVINNPEEALEILNAESEITEDVQKREIKRLINRIKNKL